MKISTVLYKQSSETQRWEEGYCDQQYDMPDRCPNCHVYGSFSIGGAYQSPDISNRSTCLFYCNHCHQFFIADFDRETYPNNSHELLRIHKESESQAQFSHLLQDMSREFCETYREATEAETNGLRRAAGPTYRKALEHLVKDFAKHNAQSEIDKINRQPLMQTIKDYIQHPSILQLAKAATWLGNDQTHTVRQHEEYDLEDLKRFVLATAKYIDLELTAGQALELLEQKRS